MHAAVSRNRDPFTSAASESVYTLWQKLAAFSAGEAEAALRELQKWIAKAVDADQVIWIGAVRVLHGAKAKTDPFFGWRLRVRSPLRPDSESYRQTLAAYYTSEHYGKLTPTYRERSHAGKDDHIGMTGRASLAGAGRFRVHRLRDRDFIDFAAFKRTTHYRLYYRDTGTDDRMTVGFPVDANTESFLLIDRRRRGDGKRRQPFSQRDAALVGAAVRGVPGLHRWLILSHGLHASEKPLSPSEREVLSKLLTGLTEKEVAHALGRKHATLHKNVTALYTRFGVTSRAALMALWLAGAKPLGGPSTI